MESLKLAYTGEYLNAMIKESFKAKDTMTFLKEVNLYFDEYSKAMVELDDSKLLRVATNRAEFTGQTPLIKYKVNERLDWALTHWQ